MEHLWRVGCRQSRWRSARRPRPADARDRKRANRAPARAAASAQVQQKHPMRRAIHCEIQKMATGGRAWRPGGCCDARTILTCNISQACNNNDERKAPRDIYVGDGAFDGCGSVLRRSGLKIEVLASLKGHGDRIHNPRHTRHVADDRLRRVPLKPVPTSPFKYTTCSMVWTRIKLGGPNAGY